MSSALADEYKKDEISSEVFKPPGSISERFDVMEMLSKNDHGETYLLTRKEDGQKFVLKTFKKSETAAEPREAEILRELSHKGLPQFEAESETDNTLCTLREYALGLSLNQYVEKSEGKLDNATAVNITMQLCDILTYLHSQPSPVIHRDVKPSNIIIDPSDNTVKLIDFGISRRYSKDAASDTTYYGTKEFSPPEQFGYAQTDSRTDIYALGVVLRYMLMGTLDGQPDDKRLTRIIDKCTAFSPDDRYKSAAAMKKDLSKCGDNRRFSTLKIIALALALYAVFAIAVVGIRFILFPQSEPNREITKENIDTREYTDDELFDMIGLSAEELRTNINTVADAIAFLDIMYPDIWHSYHIWIGDGSEAAILRSGKGILDDTIETDVGEGNAGRSDIITAVAYLLSDNYEIGGLYGFCYDSYGEFNPIASVNYIALDGEYIVFDPVLGMTGDVNSQWHLFPEMTVASLQEYVDEVVASGTMPELVSLYAVEDGQGITFRDRNSWATVLEPAIDPLYADESRKPG